MALHLLPYWYAGDEIPDHLAEHEGVAKAMDELHLRKIDLADEVFIVNCKNYIGSSTNNEMMYAIEKDIPVRFYTDDPIGTMASDKIKAFVAKTKKGSSEVDEHH